MKRLAYILFALLLWTGCTDDSAIGESDSSFLPEGAIGFSGGALTRGTPIANADGILSMGVLCGVTDGSFASSSTNNNYMDNVHVSRANSSESFTYSPIHYWPNDTNKKLSFFAYAPYADTNTNNGITVTNTTTGTPTLTYAVPTNVLNQPDLMVAAPKKDLTKSAGSIQFAMQHALTPIGFSLKGQGEKVTAIKIKGVSTSGTLTMDGSGTISWTNLNTPTATEFTAGIPGSNTATSTLTSIMNGNGYLMMIPQTLTSTAKLIVTVDGVDKEVSLTGKTWEAGKKVMYEVTIENPESVIIGNLTWATGNLVADGNGGCKIGAPEDGGLYFQFGSLVGWSGGVSGDGTGRGPDNTTPALEVKVNKSGTPAVGSTAWDTTNRYTDGTSSSDIVPDAYDPCRHYLGGTWRLPTSAELKALFNNSSGGAWSTAPSWQVSGTFAIGNTTSYAKRTASPNLQFPASGYRSLSNGALNNVGSGGYCWSAAVYDASVGYYLGFDSSYVYPSNSHFRSVGFPVRCVQDKV